MALMFFEGFETVGTSLGLSNQGTSRPRIDKRWDATASGGIPASDSFFLIDDDFSEGYAIQMGENSFSNGNYLQWDVPAAYQDTPGSGATTWVVGARVHIPVGSTRDFGWLVVDGRIGTTGFANALIFWVKDSADLEVRRGAISTLIASADDAVGDDEWVYLECKFKIADSSDGVLEVKVNGTEVINESPVDTNEFLTKGTMRFKFATVNASTTSGDYVGYDDIYILRTSGSGQNDYLGPQRIRAIPPTGDTGTMDWTTSSGTVHYSLIDENGVDTSDYVETATNNDIDMFSLTNIDDAREGNYHGVKVEAEAIISDSGSGTLDVRIDSNGTVSETNHTISSTTTYIVVEHYDGKDPSGGADFTKARIDGLEAGIEKNS